MLLKVLATGSTGNCYALWDDKHNQCLLLDAGINADRIMEGTGYQSDKIVGCVVTHEHGDHVKGVAALSGLGIKCYGTPGTAALVPGLLSDGFIKPGIRIMGDFIVMSFPTNHDAADPCGYLIQHRLTGERMIYATDTYYLTQRYPGIHYWLVECNYCDDLLSEDTPEVLKSRLKHSHMSLDMLSSAFHANDLSTCKKIILCHTSKERADTQRMVDRLHYETHKPVTIARQGYQYPLDLVPF